MKSPLVIIKEHITDKIAAEKDDETEDRRQQRQSLNPIRTLAHTHTLSLTHSLAGGAKS